MNPRKVSRWSRIPNYIDATQMTTGLLDFSDDKCDRCMVCLRICPARSILMKKEGKGRPKDVPYLDVVAPDVTLCVSCGCCMAACPNDAISVTRGFNAGHYFCRLTQAAEMTYPRRY